jgi:hypothetical protein
MMGNGVVTKIKAIKEQQIGATSKCIVVQTIQSKTYPHRSVG